MEFMHECLNCMALCVVISPYYNESSLSRKVIFMYLNQTGWSLVENDIGLSKLIKMNVKPIGAFIKLSNNAGGL